MEPHFPLSNMLPELSFKTKGEPTACNGSRVKRVTCAKCSSYALALTLTLAIITGASHSNPTIERLPNPSGLTPYALGCFS